MTHSLTPFLSRRTVVQGLFTAPAWGWLGSSLAQSRILPKEVRIGYQKGSAILLLDRKNQSVEKRLKALGVQSVKWVEFQFGPPMLEALGAGAIDVGSVGDTPPIFAQAGSSRLVYAAATASTPHAVLVPTKSPIQSVAELKGKKIAFGKGSSAHNVAIKALKAVGLTLNDVVPTYLSPADATAAFNGGNIDAWVVWDPYFAIAQQRYGARALTDTQANPQLQSASYYMASADFAQRNGTLLAEILNSLRQTMEWAGQNRQVLAELAAQDTGIDMTAWKTVFERSRFALTPVGLEQIAQQQELANTFKSLGIIPRHIQVKDIVWKWPVA